MASPSDEAQLELSLSASEKLVERWLQCMPLEREVEKQDCLDAAQSLTLTLTLTLTTLTPALTLALALALALTLALTLTLTRSGTMSWRAAQGTRRWC